MIDAITTPYKVVSHSAQDGMQIDHFYSREEAETFAKDVVEEGYTAMLLETKAVFTPESASPAAHTAVARPGVDYPFTLCPPACCPGSSYSSRPAA